jgi:hypothetical protein
MGEAANDSPTRCRRTVIVLHRKSTEQHSSAQNRTPIVSIRIDRATSALLANAQRLGFSRYQPSHRRSSEGLHVIEAELTFRGISRAIDSGAVNHTSIVSLFDHAFDLMPITAAVTGPPPKNYDSKLRVIGGSRSPHG